MVSVSGVPAVVSMTVPGMTRGGRPVVFAARVTHHCVIVLGGSRRGVVVWVIGVVVVVVLAH
nr:hypothetical protein GCM10017544_20840 [Microbacterium imperiale]